MQYVYHGSNIDNLSIIVPRKSTHGKLYVYASKHLIVSALFLARWNDFLLSLITEESHDELKVILVERYPDALSDIFKDKSGYIYYLDNSNFEMSTNWEHEVVSLKKEVVHKKVFIPNVYELIMEFEKKGKIELYKYPNRPTTIPMDDSDMLIKALELYSMSGNVSNIDYCMERFPQFRDKLLKIKNDPSNY